MSADEVEHAHRAYQRTHLDSLGELHREQVAQWRGGNSRIYFPQGASIAEAEAQGKGPGGINFASFGKI